MKSPSLAQSSNWLFTSFSLMPQSGNNGPLRTYSAASVQAQTVMLYSVFVMSPVWQGLALLPFNSGRCSSVRQTGGH